MIDDSVPYETQLARRSDALSTRAVHAGDAPDEHGILDPPIVFSSAFAFADAAQAAGAFRGENDAWIYGRWGNPTVSALETKLAALESADCACATASGMAAIAGVILSLCSAGDHIVAPRSMYAESARLFRERLPKLGITTTFVDGDAASYVAAIRDATRVLYVETPSNPRLGITDIAAVVAGAAGRKVVVDGTFATPFSQSPLALGADLVLHSMTKGIGGHGDVIGGAILGERSLVCAARDLVVKGFGGVLSPMSAWLVLRGLRTFAIRQERACRTAAALAAHLAKNPAVAAVHHPSLESHPGHTIAKKQMHAYGALFSFELAGKNGVERGRRVLESLEIATHAVSLGDARTLVVHPASTTHSTMPVETRELAGIGDALLRVSVGLEGQADLLADFDRAIAS